MDVEVSLSAIEEKLVFLLPWLDHVIEVLDSHPSMLITELFVETLNISLDIFAHSKVLEEAVKCVEVNVSVAPCKEDEVISNTIIWSQGQFLFAKFEILLK